MSKSSGVKASKDESINELRRDISALQLKDASDMYGGELADVTALKGDLTELKAAGVLAQIGGMKHDIAELKTGFSQKVAKNDEAVQAVSQEMSQVTQQFAASMQEQVKELDTLKEDLMGCVETAKTFDKESVHRLQSDVLTLREKVESMTIAGTGGEYEEQFKKLVDLSKVVKEDEAAEENAHKRLLSRIGDVCDRLAEVDSAVGSMANLDAGGKPLAVQPGTSPTLSPEFTEKFEALVSRVEEMGAVERQIQAQFGQFTSRFTAAATGAGTGGSMA